MTGRLARAQVIVLVVAAALASGCCARSPCGPCPGSAPARIAEAPPPGAAGRAAPADRVTEVLESKRVEMLVWEEATLDQALAHLRTVTGVEFTVSPRAREEKVEETVITMRLDEVSARTVLDLLTEFFGLSWQVRDGVVWIRSVDETIAEPRLRYYEVKDLIDPDRPGGYRTLEHLVDDVRDLYPGYWDRAEAALEGRKGILVVRASWTVLDGVEALLGRRRALMQGPTIDPDMRAKLERVHVTLAVSDATVGEVVKLFRLQSGYNLLIDPRIQSEVEDAPITGLKLEDVPLPAALDMLAMAAGEHAVWTSRGEVILLTYREYARGLAR